MFREFSLCAFELRCFLYSIFVIFVAICSSKNGAGLHTYMQKNCANVNDEHLTKNEKKKKNERFCTLSKRTTK